MARRIDSRQAALLRDDRRSAACCALLPLLLSLLLLSSAASAAASAASPPAGPVSYSLLVGNYSAPPFSTDWSSVFTAAQLACWNAPQQPDAASYCFADAIPLPWDATQIVCVSPAGVLWIGPKADWASCQQLLQAGFPGEVPVTIPAPDYRLLPPGQGMLISVGFSFVRVWGAGLSAASVHSAVTSEQDLMFSGTFATVDSTSSMQWTLVLSESGLIELYVSLDLSEDFPLQFGLVANSPYEDISDAELQTGTMWNSSSSPHSAGNLTQAILTFVPFANDAVCVPLRGGSGGVQCPDCLSLSPGTCAWCPASGTCLSVAAWHAGNATCAAPPVQTTCPLSSYATCTDCLVSGGEWCSGDASCSASTNTSDHGICSTVNWWVEYTLGDPIGRCVAPGGCGTQTCNEKYNTTFMACGTWQQNMLSQYYYACLCDPNQSIDTRAHPTVGLATCALCDSASCNAFHHSQHMQCQQDPDAFTPQKQCVCDAAYADTYFDGSLVASCAVCDNNTYQDSAGECHVCPELSWGVITGLILAALLVTFLAVKLNSHPLIQRLLIPVQNAVVYCQVVSLLALIDFHWPLAVQHAFSAFTIAGLNFVSLPTVACFVSDDTKAAIGLLTPIAIAAILLVCYILADLANMLRWCVAAQLTPQQVSSSATRNRLLFVRTYLTLLSLLYNFLVYTTLSTLDTMRTYSSYMSLDAFNQMLARANGAQMAACVGLVLYVLGIPLLFFAVLQPRSRFRCVAITGQCACCCRLPSERNEALRPLRSRYRPGMHLWEATFVPLWKIALNSLIVFGSRTIQIVCIAALLVALVAAHAQLRPYASGLNNREQQYLLSGSLVILLGGLLFFASSSVDSSAARLSLAVVSYCLVIATMLAMAAVIVFVIVSIVRQYRAELKGAPQLEGGEEWERQPGGAVQAPTDAAEIDAADEEGDTAVAEADQGQPLSPGAASVSRRSSRAELQPPGSSKPLYYDSLLVQREGSEGPEQDEAKPQREGMPHAEGMPSI